jgi:hypothetical protein
MAMAPQSRQSASACAGAWGPLLRMQREGCSFLKKRTKKLLSVGFRARPSNSTSGGKGERAKVFCFFFSKKKAFLA